MRPSRLTTRRPTTRLMTDRRPSVYCYGTKTVTIPTAASSSGPEATKSDKSSTFRDRFEHLRGANIEPVSDAMLRFTNSFRRPVPIVYRAVVNETITTSHLARVCAMWRFDAIFAYGFDSVFSTFLRYYPNATERDMLYRCVASCLKFEETVIRDAADAVNSWVDGKTEEDIFAALDAAATGASADSVGPVIEALVHIRDADDGDWYYSRLFGLGLIQIMSLVKTELTISNAEKWANRIGMEPSKLSSEMGNYLSSMERLKQAEQIFAEATARDAKKTAERLSEKAKKAIEEAEQLEKGADGSDEGAVVSTTEVASESESTS